MIPNLFPKRRHFTSNKIYVSLTHLGCSGHILRLSLCLTKYQAMKTHPVLSYEPRREDMEE